MNLSEFLIKNIEEAPNQFDKKIINTVEKYQNICFENDEQIDKIKELFAQLKNTMTENVGIIRNKKSLDRAINDIFEIKMQLDEANPAPSKEKYELNNALYVASLIIKAANKRQESIGAHYRTDSTISKEKEGINNNDKIPVK